MSEFDFVIVGSGLGGLACGAILGKHGYKVLILEKNKQIGGNLQTFARDKVIFDSGVHYLGGMEKGQNLYQFFKYLEVMDSLKIQKLNEEAFDKIIFGDDETEYCYAQGYDKFIEVLSNQFPEDREAIIKYCDVIKDCCTKFPLYNLSTESNSHFESNESLSTDTKTFIESITQNEKLRAVLGGNNPLYAGIADKTPLYVHALILNSYIESSYRCIDGGSQISRALHKLIKKNGGEIKKHQDVKRFVVEDGIVTHVETKLGEKFYGKNFISNIHPSVTLDMTPTEKIRPAFRHRIHSLENSVSAFVINAVMKEDAFPYLDHNYYSYEGTNVWDTMNYTEETWPRGYAFFNSAHSKSTTWSEGITLMAYMYHDEVKEWENTFNMAGYEEDRGKSYEEFKKRKAEKLLDQVEKKFPGIRNAIKSYYTSTPLTFKDYIGTTDGSMYGVVKDYKDPLKTFITPKTKVPNLFLTGQNLNLHGILGVTVSAFVTCFEFVDQHKLIEEVRNA